MTVSYKTIKKNMLLSQYLPQEQLKCVCGGHGLDHAKDCPVGWEESRSLRKGE